MRRQFYTRRAGLFFAMLSLAALPLSAAGKLRINPHLNYSSEVNQGPLITGSNMHDGAVPGAVNLIYMYAQG